MRIGRRTSGTRGAAWVALATLATGGCGSTEPEDEVVLRGTWQGSVVASKGAANVSGTLTITFQDAAGTTVTGVGQIDSGLLDGIVEGLLESDERLDRTLAVSGTRSSGGIDIELGVPRERCTVLTDNEGNPIGEECVDAGLFSFMRFQGSFDGGSRIEGTINSRNDAGLSGQMTLTKQ